MVLSLPSPVGPDFLKDFPSINTVICDSIDLFAGPCLTTHPLQTYTPQLVGTSVSPVLGTGGFIKGYYYEIFDQIYTWGEFKFGTAAITVGAGTYLVSLPFVAKSILGATTDLGASPVLGTGYLMDNDTAANRTPITVHLRTPTQMVFGTKMDNGLGRVVSNNVPFNWAINDGLSWAARFQRLA